MVVYESIVDIKNPIEPNFEEIAKLLEDKISAIERKKRAKLVSACFLGKHELLKDDEEDSLFCHAIHHNISFDFMLFFEKISKEQLC